MQTGDSTQRQLHILRIYTVASTMLLGVLSLTAFRASQKQRFTEIDVERINLVEKDGCDWCSPTTSARRR